MKMLKKTVALALTATAGLMAATPANAALTLFQQYSGNVGLSTAGAGSTASSYGVNAFVPFGATVISAHLYQTNVQNQAMQSVSLNGNALTFSSLGGSYGAGRADVTSIVSSVVNGGAGGTYNFTVGEGVSGLTDGTALVVVYSLASLPTQTVAILDGFASSGGDTTTLNLASPAANGFTGEMRLGIGFSYNAGDTATQVSTVNVNGTTITNVAGNFDDGSASNGALITVGGNDDPFSTLLPTVTQDHERYNIAPYVNVGDTAITVRTNNASNNDNIFLAAFVVSGGASVNGAVPEPATWAMMTLGFGGIGFAMRRKKTTTRIRFA
ncbi:PEPxxWA-CTERM sorting domain-containing protein [Sphingomonas sp. RS2018]